MNFSLSIIRAASVLITVLAIFLSGNHETFYSFFLAFTMSHVVLALYFSYPRFKSLAQSKQSIFMAGLISLIGIFVTFAIFPRIALIFIIHELFSEIFLPPPKAAPLALSEILKNKQVQVLRFVSGFIGLCYLARQSDQILFMPNNWWVVFFILSLSLLLLKIKLLLPKLSDLWPALLNIFSFELMILGLVILSYIYQFTLTAAHIAFFHVFFWFFYIISESNKGEIKKKNNFVWLHVSLMFGFWVISPEILRQLGYLSNAKYLIMHEFYVNIVLLTVCIHIFSSFYLSKFNPDLLKRFFYRN